MPFLICLFVLSLSFCACGVKVFGAFICQAGSAGALVVCMCQMSVNLSESVTLSKPITISLFGVDVRVWCL